MAECHNRQYTEAAGEKWYVAQNEEEKVAEKKGSKTAKKPSTV